MEQEFYQLYRTVFCENGLERYADEATAERFSRLTDALLAYNAHTNLTALRTLPEILLRHYADSLGGEPYLPAAASVIDVGAGAGFPSLPLALVRPDLSVTALDSTAKKSRFTAEAAALLGLDNLTVVTGRAEELGRDPAYRGRYDAAVSRALARMDVLAELCLPFVRRGGRFLAYKGRADEELADAAPALRTLGASLSDRIAVPLRQGDVTEEHCLLLFDKTAPTPPAYPRAFAQISKKPIR